MTEEEKKAPGEEENESFEDAQDSTPRPASKFSYSGAKWDQERSNSPTPADTGQNGEVMDTVDLKESTTNGVSHEAEQITTADTSGSPEQVTDLRRPSTKEGAETSPKRRPSPIQSDSQENVTSPPLKKGLFGWLSRNPSSFVEGLRSPPLLSRRRDTAASVTSIASMAELTGNEDNEEEAAAKKERRISLKDRFKMLRMREEAGVTLDESQLRPTSAGSNKESDPNEAVSDTETEGPRDELRRSSSVATAPKPPVVDSLAPGTAAGVAMPSSDQEGPVDWDLWQAVVYEGPAAVARTSPDVLNQAIINGIPSAIRGVVWQVLAQSKNEELESVYKDLVVRGKEAERRASTSRTRPIDLRRGSNAPTTSTNAEKDSASSHRSSRASGTSTPASQVGTSAVTSPPATLNGNLDALADAQFQAVDDEKARRSRDQGVALQKLERAIKRDLGARTSYSKFLMSAGLQNGLFGICKAYALFDEDVGYAQGMNFIAMPLLFNMPEEEAFCLFVRLMNNFHLREMFIPEMPGLHLHLYQFERLLEDFEPAVYCHLHRRGVTPQLYATQWFLTLFAYRFPLQLVLRIYDLILSDGLEGAILKFGIVLMQKNREKLLEMKDMTSLSQFLKEKLFDVYIDQTPSQSSILESGFFGNAGGIDKEVYRADELVRDACAVQITPEMLKQYTKEWQEKTREEKEKLAAEELLRANNASLNLQVRNLQERVEKADQEHVHLAGEIVRVKVDNERLSDENEALRLRLDELQNIVNGQPAEVEARLREEMDRIMKRNIEVQNENRSLEESCTEMEGELIQAKLKYAEINADLETMKKKWSSISDVMRGA